MGKFYLPICKVHNYDFGILYRLVGTPPLPCRSCMLPSVAPARRTRSVTHRFSACPPKNSQFTTSKHRKYSPVPTPAPISRSLDVAWALLFPNSMPQTKRITIAVYPVCSTFSISRPTIQAVAIDAINVHAAARPRPFSSPLPREGARPVLRFIMFFSPFPCILWLRNAKKNRSENSLRFYGRKFIPLQQAAEPGCR